MNWTQRAVLNVVKAGSVPSHIAFIMDGNRRWATDRGKRKTEGHSSGERLNRAGKIDRRGAMVCALRNQYR